MRKIILSIHTTLDGFAAGVNGEMDWIKLDDEMFDFVKTFTDNADTALYGRVTWQMMESYWPTAANKPDATRHDKEHSEWYKRVNKIVLTNTMKGQRADKTTFVNGDIAKEIRELKQQDGKDILIFGSPSAVHSLMAHSLIDEYWFFVNPVILGKGISIFTALTKHIELTRKATKNFPCGVTALNYTLIKK
jgi:dihydrofolate reductase